MLCARCLRSVALRRQLAPVRRLSTFSPLQSADPTSSVPVSEPSDAPRQPARSICPGGTVLVGLNFMKGAQDPVAMNDEEYPEWLWSCLDVKQKTGSDAPGEATADESFQTKKQQRAAAKRQKALEAKLLASGDIDAIAPKVPLQHQSINLPGEEGGSVQDNIAAAEKRNELKKAMRRERKAKIQESNYLKSM